MVFQRKYKKKRFQKRRFKKRYARKSIPRAVANYKSANEHMFKRTFTLGTNVSTGAVSGTYSQGYSFILSSVPNAIEFTSLYDQYRINGIKVRIMLRSTVVSAIETINNAGIGMPFMYYVIDRDDATQPTLVTQLQEYSKVKYFGFDTGKRICQIYWKPNTLGLVADPSQAIGNGQVQWGRWLDMNSINTPYYGLKIFITQPSNGVLTSSFFDIDCKYYFQCKDTR